MKLSVIIPTRNRAKSLERTLISLAQQTLSKDGFEVIVVDNGSTDTTAAVCAGFSVQFLHFRYLYDEHPGLHVGRNLGMEHALADILVYGDDDIEAAPGWLEGIWKAFEDSKAALVGGKNLPLFELTPPEWIARMWAPSASGERVCSPLSVLDLGDLARPVSPYCVFGCNFSIRKAVLLAADGFHPDGMPKDLIRFRGDGETHVSKHIERQGLLAFYHPGASVGHLVSRDRLTVEYFCQRSFSQGISDSFASLRERGGLAGPCRRLVQEVRWLRALPRLRAAPYPALLLAQAGRRGHWFHQQEYRRDPALREWVQRRNYRGSGSFIPTTV